MDLFRQTIDQTISQGDSVCVIGKDEYKGWVGTVTKVKEISGDKIFTIELQANHKRVERFRESLRKE